jgi:hypothetical protein
VIKGDRHHAPISFEVVQARPQQRTDREVERLGVLHPEPLLERRLSIPGGHGVAPADRQLWVDRLREPGAGR